MLSIIAPQVKLEMKKRVERCGYSLCMSFAFKIIVSLLEIREMRRVLDRLVGEEVNLLGQVQLRV